MTSNDEGTSYIEPGSPWQNGYAESFDSKFSDECLNCEEFTTVQEARVIIAQWRQGHNYRRPHRSLDGITPAAFAAKNQVPEYSPRLSLELCRQEPLAIHVLRS